MNTVGRHILAELDGCNPDLLRSVAAIRRLLIEAVVAAGATPLAERLHPFGDGGVSGVVVLAESHIAIHTWPETGYAAVDIYTCGEHTQPDEACWYLAEHLGCRNLSASAIERGLPGPDGRHEQRPATLRPRA